MLKIVVEKEESYAPEYQELFRFVLQGPRGLIYDGENVYCWEENSWSYYHESTYLFEWVGNVGTFHIPMAGYHFNADGGTYNLSIYDCWGNLVYENQYTFSGPKLEVLYEPTVYFSYATMVSYEPTLYERGVAGVTINIANTGDLPAYVHATRISVPGYGTTANSTFYLGELVTYVVSGLTCFEGQGSEYGAVLIMPGENVIFSPAPFATDPDFHTLPTGSAQFLNISLLEEKFAGSMGSMFTTGEFTRILLSYDMAINVPPE
jgi:hypothetical protein